MLIGRRNDLPSSSTLKGTEMYIVQFNDGRLMTVPGGEAKFWAWMSMEYIICNVYRAGHSILLSPFDIR
jgi:hypothetical protein